MTTTKKLSLIILITALAIIAAYAISKQKNQPEQVNKPAEIATTTITDISTSTQPNTISVPNDLIKYLESEEIDTSNWLFFDSEKDSGMKLRFSLIYPGDWLHFGSIDGGQVSSIPFYKKNLYVKKCELQSNRTEICKEEGKIAEISVRVGSQDVGDSKNVKGENYYIGAKNGFISTKILEPNVIDQHVFIANNVLEFSLADIYGMNFTFTMVQKNENSKDIFYKILNSIKFR